MNLQLLSKRRHYSRTLPARCSFSGGSLPPLGRAAWLSECDSSIPGWQQRDQLPGEAWRALQANAPRQQVTTELWTGSLRAGSGELPSLSMSSCGFFPGRTLTSVPRLGALPGLFVVESSSFHRKMWRFPHRNNM